MVECAASCEIKNISRFKQQLLCWASRYSSCCFLDNHQYPSRWQQQEWVVAVGCKERCAALDGHSFEMIDEFLQEHAGQWIFGHLGYDLHNEWSELALSRRHNVDFGRFNFFVPEAVIVLRGSDLKLYTETQHAALLLQEILATEEALPVLPKVDCHPALERDSYISIVEKLRDHILRGDCYEINYCLEFVAENVNLSPLALYQQLSTISPNPFSCYYRQANNHLACASPERYLMKKGRHLMSQPMKGTAPRKLSNEGNDTASREALRNSIKDQRENVMVVDLVRNDLSQVCEPGTVKVEELYGVYTYPQVHQMISTVGGTLRTDKSFCDIVKATFPMGSMTGAPKKRVMELISAYEKGSRGLFSGAVGYFSPEGDFDFNVVIRSVLYDQSTQQLSFFAGSGITWYSQPEKEYDECMWKAAAILRLLGKAEG